MNQQRVEIQANSVIPAGMAPNMRRVRKLLSDLLREYGNEDRLSEAMEKKLGEGVSGRQLRKYSAEDGPVPRRGTLEQLERFAGLEPGYLSQGYDDGEPSPLSVSTPEEVADNVSDYVYVPFLDGVVSAGPGGGIIGQVGVRSYLSFERRWATNKGDPKKFVIHRVSGDSMYPLAPHGAVVLIDMGRQALSMNAVYLVNHDGEMKLKRIQRWEGKIWLLSENPDFSPEPIREGEHFAVVGQALWVGYEL